MKSTKVYILLAVAVGLFWGAVAALLALIGAPPWIIPAAFLIAFMVSMFALSGCAVSSGEPR